MLLGSTKPFTTSWKTNNAGTSTSTQITVPTTSAGTYNCVVNWGDGSASVITTYNDAAWTHTYSGAGTYTVRITGTFTGIQFNNGGDRLKLLNISSWGKMRLGNTGNYFYGCTNLTVTAIDVLDLTGTTTLSGMFFVCSAITTVPSINSWDVSKVTDFSIMFDQSAFNSDVSSWNVGAGTNFFAMFYHSSFNQDVSSWNVSSGTNLSYMFNGTPFNRSLNSWVTSAATDMSFMFQGSPFNQDISGWSIAALTNASSMFLSSSFAITNYNKLLDSVTGWPSQATINSNVTFSAGNAHYSGANAIAGRAVLTGTKTWTITDGGTP